MAPPSSRRSGFSKKAQYSLFTGYLLAGAGAVVGAALLALSLWQPAAFAPLRGVAGDAVAPAGQAAAVTRSGSQGVFAAIAGYFNAGAQNAELRREMEIARIRLAEAEAVKAENRRLKGLLGLAEGEAKPVAVARLVGSTATSGRRHAFINAGSTAGVLPGMPVISERGVIGRVLETGRISARVLLLTDSESVLPVRRATDNVIAFAEGRGDGLLRIRLVNLGVNPLKVGDMMVTSGAGGYYRPGVAVAVIAKITPDGGIARLVAEPAATSFVAIEPVARPAAITEIADDSEIAGPAESAAAPAPSPSPAEPDAE
ncbi:rod shape-determining protein MreC [Porphyrobacter sp. CACIAM 03H1]|uniref:rod shape-determining protein MreC n=1 Tax=Porphyrobacter sp. CACIAM 03H1 TaxID=2003315 RepID=UPI000B5A5A08|nr:rod shape-determining protein MreC [Porphyrobacter sp. CACIAM 03H1]ASJ91269.1 rod shape-determining protein MreC [Porphyrobacter sp. CACIAM 03H1]